MWMRGIIGTTYACSKSKFLGTHFEVLLENGFFNPNATCKIKHDIYNCQPIEVFCNI